MAKPKIVRQSQTQTGGDPKGFDAIDKMFESIEKDLAHPTKQELANKAVEMESEAGDVLAGPPDEEPDPFHKMAQKFWDSWEPSDGCISLADFVAAEIQAAAKGGETISPDQVRGVLALGGIRAWGTNMHVTTEISVAVWTNGHMWSWDPKRSLLWRRTDEPPLWLKVQVQPPEPQEDFDDPDRRGEILENALGHVGELARAVDKLVKEFRADRIERTAAMKDLIDRLEPALDEWLKAKAKEQS